jgi:hypothetical protein
MSQTRRIRSSCFTPAALFIVCLIPVGRLGAQQSHPDQPVLASQAPVTSAEFDR